MGGAAGVGVITWLVALVDPVLLGISLWKQITK